MAPLMRIILMHHDGEPDSPEPRRFDIDGTQAADGRMVQLWARTNLPWPYRDVWVAGSRLSKIDCRTPEMKEMTR